MSKFISNKITILVLTLVSALLVIIGVAVLNSATSFTTLATQVQTQQGTLTIAAVTEMHVKYLVGAIFTLIGFIAFLFTSILFSLTAIKNIKAKTIWGKDHISGLISLLMVLFTILAFTLTGVSKILRFPSS